MVMKLLLKLAQAFLVNTYFVNNDDQGLDFKANTLFFGKG